jgi:hypothetical protein
LITCWRTTHRQIEPTTGHADEQWIVAPIVLIVRQAAPSGLCAAVAAGCENGCMTRLPVLDSTIKQLYGTATACAYPNCGEPLLRWVVDLDVPVLNSRGHCYDHDGWAQECRGWSDDEVLPYADLAVISSVGRGT